MHLIWRLAWHCILSLGVFFLVFTSSEQIPTISTTGRLDTLTCFFLQLLTDFLTSRLSLPSVVRFSSSKGFSISIKFAMAYWRASKELLCLACHTLSHCLGYYLNNAFDILFELSASLFLISIIESMQRKTNLSWIRNPGPQHSLHEPFFYYHENDP